MAKKKPEVPKYGTIILKGIQYYRTRIMDADGKQVSLYAITCEELYEKELEARRQVEEIIFHRQHPTVAERSQILEHNPCEGISGKGGKPAKKRDALTDQQVAVLLDTVKGLPPYLFVMLGLYSGLRREEILALQWDCVFLDEPTPYLSVRRAWRTEHNRPVVSTVLKSKAAKRDIPIHQASQLL